MDPVSLIPPEVMENIWADLEFKDLLNCRLVTTSWTRCLSADPVWKKYLVKGKPSLPSWKTFLRTKKMDYRWKNGIYNTYTEDKENSKLAVGDNNIYLGSGRHLRCLSKKLEKVNSYLFDKNIAAVHSFSDMLAVVLNENENDYTIHVYNSTGIKKYFVSDLNIMSAGEKLFCFKVKNTLVVYDGETSNTHALPEDVIQVLVINERVFVKSVSSVYTGSNVCFYLLGEDGWEVVWKGKNFPMGCMFGQLEATDDCVAMVGGTYTQGGFWYSGLQIYRKGIVDEIEPSRNDYFRSHSTSDSILYMPNPKKVKRYKTKTCNWEETEVDTEVMLIRSRGDSLIVIYRGKWEVWSGSNLQHSGIGPAQIEDALVKEDFLTIWSKFKIYVYNFVDPEDCLEEVTV